MFRLAWHFDLHTPGYVPLNTSPDYQAMAKALKTAGVEEIICFAKCHFGYSYYPTKVGTVHPGMKGDLFGEVRAACRKVNLKVLAYVSFGVDGQAGRKHPQWQRIWETETVISDQPDIFLQVCPFTPYTEELMLPQIEEIITLYQPDGFFFDTMSALAPCRCVSCEKAFREETGKKIPEEENSADFALFGSWRRKRGMKLIQKIAAFILLRLPQAQVGFNQIGSLPYPERMPEEVTVLTLDPPTPGPQSLQLATNAAYSVTVDRPSDVMPTIFNQGWGDWSLAPLVRMEQAAATIWSHGARLYLGDRLRPEGFLDQQTLVALKFIKKVKDRILKQAPETGSRIKPDILILHTPELAYGDDERWFATGKSRERTWQLIGGSHRLLLEAGTNVAVSAECFLKKFLSDSGLVVLPELTNLKPETAQVLRDYVEKGGCLVMVGSVPAAGTQQLDWAGVRISKEICHDHVYLPPWQQQGSLPVLVRGPFYRLELEGAEKILPAIFPYHARPGKPYGWGIGPANCQVSDQAAITCYHLGQGQVWYLNAAFFSDYYRHGNWQQVLWWKEFLRQLPVNFRVQVDSPSGKIQVVLWEKGESWWIFLINHSGEEIFGTTSPVWGRTVTVWPQKKVVLKLNRNRQKALRISCGKKMLSFTQTAGYVYLSLVVKGVWQILRVDWAAD